MLRQATQASQRAERAQNRPARPAPHSPGQRPGRWGDIKGNCALQGQNHQTCPKGVLSPLCYALALGFAAFIEKELVRFRNNVEKESVSFVAERPLRGVCARSALWDACVACRSKNCYISPQNNNDSIEEYPPTSERSNFRIPRSTDRGIKKRVWGCRLRRCRTN